MTRTAVEAPGALGAAPPVLVGACDPHSHDPAHALWPDPAGSIGHRMVQLIRAVRPGATASGYLRRFRRENLCRTPRWDADEAAARAMCLLMSLPPGTTAVILGEDARAAADRALGLPRLLLHPQEIRGARGVRIRQLPHPFGRCRWYDHLGHRLVAGLLLAELYDDQ